MRKLVVSLITVAVLVLAVFLALTFSLNRIIEQNRDLILQRAQATLGRAVTVDKITLSIWGGLGVRLENVRIADDPRFSASEFARSAVVTARAELWPLLRRRFIIGAIEFVQPHVQLIRDATGHWNCESLGAAPVASSTTAPEFMLVADAQPAAEPFSIRRFAIRDGSLVVTDHTKQPAEVQYAQHIDLTLKYVNRTTPLHFNIDAALAHDAQNVHLTGNLQVLGNDSIPQLDAEGALGPFGANPLHIEDLHLTAVATPDVVRTSQLEGRVFDGKFALSAQYPRRKNQELKLGGELTDIDVGKLLQSISAGGRRRTKGRATVKLDLHAPEPNPATVAGTVIADIRDGVIEDFNLVDEVLGQITALPGIDMLISRNVKPKYARLFEQLDTRFETLHGTFQIAEQRVHTDDLAIIATDYGTRAKGWAQFTGDADVSGTLLMSREFSDDVVADVKEAKYLLDDHGQLAVPYRLRGKLGQAKPRPDSDYLISLLARTASRGAVKDLLNSLVGGKHRGQPTAADPRNQVERTLRELLGR
jgi:hypothetical protein